MLDLPIKSANHKSIVDIISALAPASSYSETNALEVYYIGFFHDAFYHVYIALCYFRIRREMLAGKV